LNWPLRPSNDIDEVPTGVTVMPDALKAGEPHQPELEVVVKTVPEKADGDWNVTPGSATKRGAPSQSYVNRTPKTLLPCCDSARPQPDSTEFHQMSVKSVPQSGAALPKGWRVIAFDQLVPPMVPENRAHPAWRSVGAKSIVAEPTGVAVTWPGSKVALR
jgi:hypothetical protein